MKALIRETKETHVRIARAKVARVSTGLPFYDHMLAVFLRYADLPLSIEAKGDLRHHLMEDVAITLGGYVRRVMPATAARYGERSIPMDDTLVRAVLDAGGRPFFRGKLPSQLYTHWFRSFAFEAGITLHLDVLRGDDRHHILEAAFKATGLALAQALRDDGRVFSTKGTVSWAEEP